MITLSSLSIGPRATRTPRLQPPTASTWAVLDRQIAEANRLIRQYPGRRQVAAAARINAKAIYAARAIQAALPRARDPLCAQTCHEQAEGRGACDELYCKATVRMQPRPRSIRP